MFLLCDLHSNWPQILSKQTDIPNQLSESIIGLDLFNIRSLEWLLPDPTALPDQFHANIAPVVSASCSFLHLTPWVPSLLHPHSSLSSFSATYFTSLLSFFLSAYLFQIRFIQFIISLLCVTGMDSVYFHDGHAKLNLLFFCFHFPLYNAIDPILTRTIDTVQGLDCFNLKHVPPPRDFSKSLT